MALVRCSSETHKYIMEISLSTGDPASIILDRMCTVYRRIREMGKERELLCAGVEGGGVPAAASGGDTARAATTKKKKKRKTEKELKGLRIKIV